MISPASGFLALLGQVPQSASGPEAPDADPFAAVLQCFLAPAASGGIESLIGEAPADPGEAAPEDGGSPEDAPQEAPGGAPAPAAATWLPELGGIASIPQPVTPGTIDGPELVVPEPEAQVSPAGVAGSEVTELGQAPLVVSEAVQASAPLDRGRTANNVAGASSAEKAPSLPDGTAPVGGAGEVAPDGPNSPRFAPAEDGGSREALGERFASSRQSFASVEAAEVVKKVEPTVSGVDAGGQAAHSDTPEVSSSSSSAAVDAPAVRAERTAPTPFGGGPIVGSESARRVAEAVEYLRNAPPPRHMVVELPDLGDLRLQVALHGTEVHLSVVEGRADAGGLNAFVREVASVFEGRGFQLADGTGTGRDRGTPDQRNDNHPSGTTAARRARRENGRTGLRL